MSCAIDHIIKVQRIGGAGIVLLFIFRVHQFSHRIILRTPNYKMIYTGFGTETAVWYVCPGARYPSPTSKWGHTLSTAAASRTRDDSKDYRWGNLKGISLRTSTAGRGYNYLPVPYLSWRCTGSGHWLAGWVGGGAAARACWRAIVD